MSGYKDKSEQNATAAEMLTKNGLHTSSIHCSYYSSIQYVLHILFKKLNTDSEKFNADARNNHKGTHKWASDLIEIEIAHKSKPDFKRFQKELGELKALREKSDYSETSMIRDDSSTAQQLSQSLNRLLQSLFK